MAVQSGMDQPSVTSYFGQPSKSDEVLEPLSFTLLAPFFPFTRSGLRYAWLQPLPCSQPDHMPARRVTSVEQVLAVGA